MILVSSTAARMMVAAVWRHSCRWYAAAAGPLAEVALGPLRVVGPEDVAELLEGEAEGVERLECHDRDLDVEIRLRAQSRHGGRADVIDPHRHLTERRPERLALRDG